MTRRGTPLAAAMLALTVACAQPEARRGGADEAGGVPESAIVREGSQAGDRTSIVVNGMQLPAETVRQLQQVYPVAIAPGRYWYDAVSGGYGPEGGPIVGQMVAGLALGGPLRADASRGTSGVFINGRQITAGEKAYIERLCQTPVAPARYWILANGLGGYEGGAASFDLGQCPGVRQQSAGRGSSSRTWCDGNGACTSTGILGSITTTPD